MKDKIEQINNQNPVFSEAEATSKILAAIDADVRSTAIEFLCRGTRQASRRWFSH